jgi:hypothetical protein
VFTRRIALLFCLVAVGLTSMGTTLRAQKIGLTYTFQSSTDGQQPAMIIQARDGNFYGITSFGGSAQQCQDSDGAATGCGTIFRLNAQLQETATYSFTGGADGGLPTSLVQGQDGNIYGTTLLGGPDSAKLDLCSVTDGSTDANGNPNSAPCCLDQNGNPLTCGTIFEFDPTQPSITPITLYTFSGNTDGASPGTLVLGSTASAPAVIFGTTLALTNCNSPFDTSSGTPLPCAKLAGYSTFGTIFSFVPSGATPVTPHTVGSLSSNSGTTLAYPNSLIQLDQSSLYGTAQMGGDSNLSDPCPANTTGTFGCGGIFKVNLAGPTLTELCDFGDNSCLTAQSAQLRHASRPGQPHPAILMKQSGSRFPVGANTWDYATDPIELAADSNGNIYGTTPAGCAVNSQYSLNPNCGSTPSEQSSIFQWVPAAKGSTSSTGTLNLLYTFSGNGTSPSASLDGEATVAGLTLASDGNFYGLSGDGATAGELYKLPLQSGALPAYVGLGANYSPDWMIQGSDGNFYGTSSTSSSSSAGSVFQVVTSPSLAPPVQLCWRTSCTASQVNPTAGISVGNSATLTWAVPAAFSLSSQQCSVFVQGSQAGAGTLKTAPSGSLVNGVFTNSIAITPTLTGTYQYAVTCGGQVTSFATLVVSDLGIATTSLPDGVIGNNYSASLTTNNKGVPPYTWSIASGSLPAGISLNGSTGALSGIPTQLGTSSFSVQVVDSAATPSSVTAPLTLTIDGAEAVLSTGQLTFQANGGLTSAAQTVTLQNPGDLPLTISSITTAGDFSEVNNCGATLAAHSSCTITVSFTPATQGSEVGELSIVDNASSSAQTVALSGTVTALQFVPAVPCRIADTRNAAGPFGGPAVEPGQARSFVVPQSACGIPSSALAYALNVTVVPQGVLNYLTAWPTGQAQPLVSLLNSPDGRVKANATILPAGTDGAISVYTSAQAATHVIIDISGYFVPATGSSLDFYPVTPCRIADTRNATGPFGGPALSGGKPRAFSVTTSDCQIPANARAYSLNVTALPHSPLNYLTIWPTGQSQPTVSTLNASTGLVTANAAIVPAGEDGQVSVFVTQDADLVLDVNGYFAPPAVGGSSLYTLTPCRTLDTRDYPFPPFPGVYTTSVQGSNCQVSTTATAYVLNATAIPTGSLSYLTLWAAGTSQPLVSTLNSPDGSIVSNMAIVPTNNGAIDAYTMNETQLILDISSYFAP